MLVERTKVLKKCQGTGEDNSIGAMSSERQVKIVEDYVEQFRKDGAKILIGGKRNAAAGPLFFEPTVITDVRNDMRAMQEETFGPTLPIATFKTEDEAIDLANDSEFGLTASVWTRDLLKGKRVAEKIEAGSVTVNEVLYTHGIGQTPWGGFKNSGRGRTHGVEGLMELVQPQHIHVNRFAILPNAWWMPYSPTAVETYRGFAKYFATGSILKTTRLLPNLVRRIKELLKWQPR
jgi:succinate-semialdehyde dehydrogenase/glutarate-semialdehyde dehydrogenase